VLPAPSACARYIKYLSAPQAWCLESDVFFFRSASSCIGAFYPPNSSSAQLLHVLAPFIHLTLLLLCFVCEAYLLYASASLPRASRILRLLSLLDCFKMRCVLFPLGCFCFSGSLAAAGLTFRPLVINSLFFPFG
jgi:hypothetical protein